LSADDSQYPESLILSAPQQFASGRSSPRSELHDCITATCDAPLDTMWAQAFKLGDDVVTVKGFTPREVQEAGLIFEDAPQPIVPRVALPPSNMSDRDESLEAFGKEDARQPGQDGAVATLSELSATHAGPDASHATYSAPDAALRLHVILEDNQDPDTGLELELDNVRPRSQFWSFDPKIDVEDPSALTNSKHAAKLEPSLLADGVFTILFM
jgi:hypothetical protein